MVRCLNCGYQFDAEKTADVCPDCGIKDVHVKTGDDVGIHFRADLVAEKRGQQGLEGIRWTSDAGRDISADSLQGQVRSSISAPSRPGESGTLEVAKKLVDRLNSDGATWREPRRVKQQNSDVDCFARGQACTAGRDRPRLCVQVTRPEFQNDSVWRILSKGQTAVMDQTAKEAAAEVYAAIMKKARRTAPAQRKYLVLAIDALETPGLLLDPVPAAFGRLHGDSVRAFGFQAIWLVGPNPTSTIRLAP